MVIILGLVIGALLGGFNARRAKGSWLDIAQYAAVGALIGGVLAAFLTLVLARML
jgi:small basic protein